jgi:hypothetical protein
VPDDRRNPGKLTGGFADRSFPDLDRITSERVGQPAYGPILFGLEG